MARCLNHGIHWIRITCDCNDHSCCTEMHTPSSIANGDSLVSLNLDIKYSTIYRRQWKTRHWHTVRNQGPPARLHTIHHSNSSSKAKQVYTWYIYLTSGFTANSAKKAPTIGMSILSLMKVGTTYPAGFIPKGLDPYRPKQLASGFRPKRQGIRSDELPTAWTSHGHHGHSALS